METLKAILLSLPLNISHFPNLSSPPVLWLAEDWSIVIDIEDADQHISGGGQVAGPSLRGHDLELQLLDFLRVKLLVVLDADHELATLLHYGRGDLQTKTRSDFDINIKTVSILHLKNILMTLNTELQDTILTLKWHE